MEGGELVIAWRRQLHLARGRPVGHLVAPSTFRGTSVSLGCFRYVRCRRFLSDFGLCGELWGFDSRIQLHRMCRFALVPQFPGVVSAAQRSMVFRVTVIGGSPAFMADSLLLHQRPGLSRKAGSPV